MTSMNAKGFYDFFHRGTKFQKRGIGKDNFTYRNLLELLEKYSRGKKNFLDIGCGSGAISLFIANQGKRVLGIDISKISIDACREGSKKLKLSNNTSFEVMDFPKKKPDTNFDVVICSEVLEHIEDDKKALEEIHNLLGINGFLIISVPSENAPLYRLGLARRFDIKVGHLRRYNLNQLVSLCERLGFTILETGKAEGILRNFLFLNPVAGKTIRFIKGPVANLVIILDNISLKLFGESQIFIVAQKK